MGDVAERAGVSLKSVSRVVNGERHVSPQVTARVMESIAALGYRPDRRARDLAASPNTGRLVGFVQVDAANPFLAMVNRGLEDATAERGLLVLSGSTDADPAREEALVHTLVEFRVEGLVVVAAEGSDDQLRREVALGTPLVCVDRVIDDLVCDTVVSENLATTHEAVSHLVSRGHRRIAYLGGDVRVWTARERLAGFREGMAAAGLPVLPGLEVLDVDTPPLAAAATARLLRMADPPTALVTAQDRITTGAVQALHAAGRQHDIALFGFDDVPFAAELQPSLSLVVQDPYAMGHRAGQLLLARMADPARPPHQVILDAPLVHRASGEIPPPR
jgi:LacI family transcriptional regulator